jgi:hypothetical protein
MRNDFNGESEIEGVVASIAIRGILASAALANIVVFLAGSELERGELGTLVGSVAEGLVLGKTARAIVVLLADLQLYPESQHIYCLGAFATAYGSVIFCLSSSVSGNLCPALLVSQPM